MAKKKLIAGNWKMNYTAAETAAFLAELKPLVKPFGRVEICVIPPFTSLAAAKKAVKGSKIRIGAQNIAWADSGAFTGEVSADMLIEAGAEYVVIGHSERRQMFGETDETVNQRVLKALEKGLKPIICVGETDYERSVKKTKIILTAQLKDALANVGQEQLENVCIAYEPVWAIGTGNTATPQDANATIRDIRKLIAELYDKAAAKAMRILYGGSMNGKNCAELLAMRDIDGGLIGGASLKAAEFASIAEAALKKN